MLHKRPKKSVRNKRNFHFLTSHFCTVIKSSNDFGYPGFVALSRMHGKINAHIIQKRCENKGRNAKKGGKQTQEKQWTKKSTLNHIDWRSGDWDSVRFIQWHKKNAQNEKYRATSSINKLAYDSNAHTHLHAVCLLYHRRRPQQYDFQHESVCFSSFNWLFMALNTCVRIITGTETMCATLYFSRSPILFKAPFSRFFSKQQLKYEFV